MEHALSFQVVPLETAAAGGLNPCLRCDAPSLPGFTEGDARWLRTVDEWARKNLFDTFWEQAFARRVLALTPGIEADDVEVQEYVRVGTETYKVDFYIPKAKLILEIDGYAKDGEPVSQIEIEKRNRRDATCQSDGLTILHFSNAQVSLEPEACRSQVASILTLRSTQSPDLPRPLDSEQHHASKDSAGGSVGSQLPNSTATNKDPNSRSRIAWILICLLAVAVTFGVALTLLSRTEPTPANSTAPAPANPTIQVQTTTSILPMNGNCPPTYPLKGNNTDEGELIVHSPGQQFYSNTKAELCFASIDDAEAAGYRPSKR